MSNLAPPRWALVIVLMGILLVLLGGCVAAMIFLTGMPAGPSLFPDNPAADPTNVILRDDFSDDRSGWATGTNTESSVEYHNGKLVIQLFTDNYFVWTLAEPEDLKGLHIEVTAENISGEESTAFGIVCNAPTQDNYYYLAITGAGHYAIAKAAKGEDDKVLVEGNAVSIQRHAQAYRIGADCGAGQLTLYVDGEKIETVRDSTFAGGSLGLFVYTSEASSAEVRFDDLVVTKQK